MLKKKKVKTSKKMVKKSSSKKVKIKKSAVPFSSLGIDESVLSKSTIDKKINDWRDKMRNGCNVSAMAKSDEDSFNNINVESVIKMLRVCTELVIIMSKVEGVPNAFTNRPHPMWTSLKLLEECGIIKISDDVFKK